MKKLFCLLVLCASIASAQNISKEIKQIDGEDSAKSYVKGKKKKYYKILTFNEENHKTKLAQDLIGSMKGRTKVVRSEYDKTYYKVLKSSKDPHYRLSYIYLDQSKLSIDEITRIKKIILKKHAADLESFSNLAKQYSMAKNSFKGGDTNWVKIQKLPLAMRSMDEILDHSVGDVYTVSNEDNTKFYIVKKTHKVRRLKETKVLKVIERL